MYYYMYKPVVIILWQLEKILKDKIVEKNKKFSTRKILFALVRNKKENIMFNKTMCSIKINLNTVITKIKKKKIRKK